MANSRKPVSEDFIKVPHPSPVQGLRQREEDYWISEEELLTEGSSDEEAVTDIKKRGSRSKEKQQSCCVESESSVTGGNLSERGETEQESSDSAQGSLTDDQISWRPKWGKAKFVEKQGENGS